MTRSRSSSSSRSRKHPLALLVATLTFTSVNITAVVITFVSAVASNSESSVLTAVQLLWVNLIMDTFAALALATDPATKTSLDRKPDRKTAPLISIDMIKMIITQAVYQIAVCLILHFLGMRILKMDNNDENQTLLSTLVFNCFVLCQICALSPESCELQR